MASVLKSGTAVSFSVTPGMGSFPQAAHSVSLAVMIGGEMVWEDQTKILWADAVEDKVTFPAEASVITAPQAFATFVIRLWNEDDTPASPAQVANEVIIEQAELLTVLTNSFGTWGDLTLMGHNMPSLKQYSFADDDSRKAALIQAYHNIGDVHVNFDPPRSRSRWHDQSQMWDGEGVFGSTLERIWSTRQLDSDLWAKLHPIQKEKLVRAQVIEANFLLSDQTPEKQRLAGLLSHSAGESAHFYRTLKPLELPVCRATALAMKGIISYVVRIAG